MPEEQQEIAFPEVQNNAQVKHPQFGVGRVIMRIGTDEKSKAIVRFKEEGEKKLSLKYAKLAVDKVEEEPEPEGGEE